MYLFFMFNECAHSESKKFLNDFSIAVKKARWWDTSRWTEPLLLEHSYLSHVYPGNINADTTPNDFIEFIVNKMRQSGLHNYINDMPRLMDKYPDKVECLLNACASTQIEGRRPLNRLAVYFFNDENRFDSSLDDKRIIYLNILAENNFPISEYDKRVIDVYMPDLIKRHPEMQTLGAKLSKNLKSIRGVTP